MTNLGEKREDILRNKDGGINEDQLIKELSDFDGMLGTLNHVTSCVFNLSKFYIWDYQEVEDMREDKKEEVIHNEVHDIILYDIESMETVEEIKEYLKQF